MTFGADELVIQFGQQRAIRQNSAAKGHVFVGLVLGFRLGNLV